MTQQDDRQPSTDVYSMCYIIRREVKLMPSNSKALALRSDAMYTVAHTQNCSRYYLLGYFKQHMMSCDVDDRRSCPSSDTSLAQEVRKVRT